MRDVTVCLPWRATPDRIAARDHCTTYWETNGYTVIEADSDPGKPFLCNQARNNAVEQAATDIVIVADADTIPETLSQIVEAVDHIEAGRYDVIWPHTIYRYISAEHLDELDLKTIPVQLESYDAPGGIVVADRETYWRIGGYPENFTPGVNGYDDTAFLYIAQTLTKTTRIPGVIYSYNHHVDGGRIFDETNPNYRHFQPFEDAYENPDAMRKLIKT